ERRPKDSEALVQIGAFSPDQSTLDDQQYQPSREHHAVHVQQGGQRRRRMNGFEEISRPEADDGGEQKRHRHARMKQAALALETPRAGGAGRAGVYAHAIEVVGIVSYGRATGATKAAGW